MKQRKEKNLHPDWRMTKGERGCYYTSESARLFTAQLITNYMTVFLLFQGVDTAMVATSVLVVKIVDSVDDVIFGFLVDKLDLSKWKLTRKIGGEGKYMPWYRMCCWTVPLATILFFLMPRSMPMAAKVAWFTVFYLLYDLTCTLSEVPMSTLIVTLTDNIDERNHILTVKGVITVIAAVIIAVVGQYLISEKVGFSISSVMIGFCIFFVILMIPMIFKVKEHNVGLKNVEKTEEKEKYTVRDMLKCVFTNKYIFIYFLSILAYSCLATSAATQTLTGFYIFHDSNIYSYIMLVGFVPGIILSCFCDRIVKRFGKRNSLVGIFLIIATANFLLFSLRGQTLAVFVVIGGICAIPNALYSIITNYVAPDTIEYTRYKTGKDCSAIFFSLKSFITKATSGVASALGLYIMAIAGWQTVEADSFATLAANNVQQTESALNALWACTYLVPGIGVLLAGVIMMFYNLRDEDAQLMAECNAGHISREECEAGLSRKY
ncbi:MAG: MFS transporter [Lachnospiraceae bacterium]|nr:MFS transporter [Lachnospiraceae bacterium]